MQRPLLILVFNVERMTVSPHDLTGELVEHQASIGAAKAKTVGHDTIELNVINTLNGDWQPFRLGVERVDVCRSCDKVVFHHQ